MDYSEKMNYTATSNQDGELSDCDSTSSFADRKRIYRGSGSDENEQRQKVNAFSNAEVANMNNPAAN